MAFLNQLSEKLEAQKIYDGLSGKYETHFNVDGVDYAFLATSVAGDTQDNYQWMLEFENCLSHRIGMGDNNPNVAKAFSEAVDQWIKERSPNSFFTFGSHIDSLKSIIEGIKKKANKYNIIDDTAEKKNEDTGEVIEGNPIGRVLWTKMLEQETIPTEERANKKNDEFETKYEEPKDLNIVDKEFLSGTAKTDNLDKGDKAYDSKTESFAEYKQTIEEGLKVEELIKKAKSVMKKFKEKFSSEFDKALSIASDKDKLTKWLDSNKDAFINAIDVVKHMTDKQELKFEGITYQSTETINESLLDFVAKKSPKAITAAAIILTLMGTGTKVFGARDSGEDAYSKAKSGVEKIVNAVKQQAGDKKKDVDKTVKSGKEKAEEVKKDVDKTIETGKEKFQDFKKNAIETGKEDYEKASDVVKSGFKDFMKKKEEMEPEIQKGKEAVKSGIEAMKPELEKGKEFLKKGFNKFKSKIQSVPPKEDVPGEAEGMAV